MENLTFFNFREGEGEAGVYPDLQVEVCETLGAESVDLWPEDTKMTITRKIIQPIFS